MGLSHVAVVPGRIDSEEKKAFLSVHSQIRQTYVAEIDHIDPRAFYHFQRVRRSRSKKALVARSLLGVQAISKDAQAMLQAHRNLFSCNRQTYSLTSSRSLPFASPKSFY